MPAERLRRCKMKGMPFCKNEMPALWVDPLEQVLDAGCFLHPSVATLRDSIDALHSWPNHWIHTSDKCTSDNQMQARDSASHLVVSKYTDLCLLG